MSPEPLLSSSADPIVLRARGMVKEYPGTTALKGVDFDVHRGKVNVLIGENGAGKSTLMKVLAGVEEPTRGALSLNGKSIRLRSTTDARRHRIAMVHQELNLLPNMNVAENIFAGREISNRFGWVDHRLQAERGKLALSRLGSDIETRALVESIPLGGRQVVELARALAQEAQILILDEPTSALSMAEVEVLFGAIDELQRQGVSIIYISHRLDELLRIGDRFTVLRDGQVAGTCSRGEVSRYWMVERMTGRSAALSPMRMGRAPGAGVRLKVENISLARSSPATGVASRELLRDVSFTLASGEVLGIFGLLGSGRTELMETLAGLHPEAAGTVTLNGRRLSLKSPRDCARHGLMLIPEDRKTDGLMLELSIRQNIAAAGVENAARWGFPRSRKELASIRSVASRLNLRAPDLSLPVSSLSGGNQQKVLLARAILRSPSVLLLDEPTRGVDVGAKVEIYTILRQLAAEGIGIVFTTSELEEIHALADRVLVLGRGRIRLEQNVGEAPDEELLAAASPVTPAAREVRPNHA